MAVGVAVAEPHWAFVPPVEPTVPVVADAEWCRTPIDRFVRAAQERKGLTPGEAAGREALLRRLTFDLTGLPPTPAETAAFVADDAPDAYERVVERLLASPHYGERWGRFWLDAARYADSNGQDENYAIANAWRYRDWVIDSFNADLPFDDFVKWQIAGDLLAEEAGLSERERFDRVTATGYLVLGPKMLAEQDKEKLLLDVVDEQLDTIGRGLLGVSFSCARCHDHKYDPVSQREYSALAGILRSTQTMANLEHVSRWHERQVATKAELAAIARHKQEVAANDKALAAATAAANDELLAHRRAEVAQYFVSATTLLAANDGSGLQPAAVQAEATARNLSLERLQRWLDRLEAQTELPAFADAGAAERWLREMGERRELLTTRRPGRVGAALHCRDQQVVDVPHRAELEPAELTVEAWVRMAAYPAGETGDRRWIVNKNDDEWAKGHYALMIKGSGIGAYVNPEGGRENTLSVWSKQDLLKLGKWHHLAMSYDGTNLKVYLDGKQVGERGGGRARQPGTLPLRIGGRQDNFNYYEGDVDEVALYGRVLKAAEIAKRATAPESARPGGLIQQWSFEPETAGERAALANGRLFDLLYGDGGALRLGKEARKSWSTTAREQVTVLEKRQKELRQSEPLPPAMTPAVAAGKPKALPVFSRGDHTRPDGEPVPRGLPAALSTPGMQARHVIAPDESGRLQLAAWLVDRENPLTARVFVNRTWQAFFGNGLVRSPQNFGTTGALPTHPELLDYLAVSFMDGGWSVKALHRRIVTSSTYRLAAAAPSAADPENRWLTQVPRRRLEAEMVRDAILAVAGDLDRTQGGSLLNYKLDKYVPKNVFPRESVRRSLYLPVIRDRGYDVLEIFDFANAAACSGRRQASVVAPQALFFLNSELTRRQAGRFAERAMAAAESDSERLQWAWRRAFGRTATTAELQLMLAYLAKPPAAPVAGERSAELGAWIDVCQVLFAANEFIYLD